MCGIAAIFSPHHPLSSEALEKGIKRLHHRGPDGSGRWIAHDGKVGLGHARLSIIDLTTGDQPIANEDESLHIVVNGELYGYEAIRKDLEQSGHELRTQSDSEIILHLYEDMGTDCLERLRGEFAFVLWDSGRRTIFAARDRFGIKPLFYAEYKQVLYLASEAKALFAAGVPARWNGEALSGCLAFSGQQTRTLFDGVFQVPPGHYLIATDQGIQLKKYWDFDYPKLADYRAARSDEDYTEEFKLALEEAVRLRLRADVPVACYLSGGIDSCAVLGLAARHHSGPVRAFTLTFDRAEYDEGAVAREMATKAGADFVPIPIRQDDLADHFVPAIVQAEALCVNAHGVAKYLLSKAVNNAGYKVVLTGEGSDEVLGGYLHFRRDAAIHNGNGHATDGIRRILGFVPYWIEISAAQSEKLQEVIDDKSFRSQQCQGDEKLFGEIDVAGQLRGRDRLNQSLYLWAKTRLPNYILTLLGDRMEMAHSVEGRLPFLDHKLVELTRSYPGTQKIRGGIQKYVLRESMRDVITDTVYRRPKHPFLAPPAALNLESRLSSRIQDTLRGPVLTSIPFFERAKVLRLLDNLPAMDEGSRVANDPVLMILLSACALQEGFKLAS